MESTTNQENALIECHTSSQVNVAESLQLPYIQHPIGEESKVVESSVGTANQDDPANCSMPLAAEPLGDEGHIIIESSEGALNQCDRLECSVEMDAEPLLAEDCTMTIISEVAADQDDRLEFSAEPDAEPRAGDDGPLMEISEETSNIEPYEGMEFDSEEAARIFYNAYAMRAGFGSRVSRNRRSRKSGENIARNFVCSKEGYRLSKHGNSGGRYRRQRAVTREGCRAMITIKKTNVGKWLVTKFVKEHNHELLTPSEVHSLRSHRVGSDTKKLVAKTLEVENTEVSHEADDYEMMESSEGATILEPYEGMELESEEAARIFYSAYARRVGFRSRISKNRRSRKDGEIIARKFVCCKEGFRAKQHENKKDRIYRPRAITREGCEAMIMVKKINTGKWVVSKFVKGHNHPLLDPSKPRYLRSNSNVSYTSKKLTEISDGARIGENGIMSACSTKDGRNSNAGFTEQDCGGDVLQPIRKRKKSPERVGQNVLDYLKRMQSENPTFFYATQVDEDESLCCIFWADARARMAYNYFGDVVCFDTTYKTNQFEVPFAPFMGVNHHQQSTFFGCVLLLKETELSFDWIFKTWLEAMSGRHPVTIITDQDEAIGAAVAHVFPKTNHCFCKWQILNKVPKQLSHLDHAHSTFQEEFEQCINQTKTIYEFESCWKSLVDRYNLRQNERLTSLYSAREKWVPVCLQDTFFAQMRTTQRSESINSFFDEFVKPRTTLQEFITQYERALASQYEKELEEDVQTAQSKPNLKTRLPIEKQVLDIYTRTMFMKIQEELFESLGYVANKVNEEGAISTYSVAKYEEHSITCTVTFNVSEGRASCSCQLFEFSGIICRHALIVLTASNVMTLPSHYILERWTRNAKSGAGMDKRGIAMQANCQKSLALRYSLLCKQAIRCAEVGATSVQDYDVAVRALQQAWEKIVASRKKVARATQLDTPISGSSQGNNISAQSEVDSTPNCITLCDPQPSKIRGRPRSTSLKPNLETASKTVRKCSICKEHGHDNSSCPRLRPIGGNFDSNGGLILDEGPSGHDGMGGEQAGFSDGILCLSLGDHFDSHGTPGISSFGPNSFFQITSLSNPRLFNVNEEFLMPGTRPPSGS
ncbi:protein FAR1-RELATED SEQUENCE 5-like [Tasmannia lanceolata]|uniref:protein FAR1-RELATED SEQUENCE 5-like n=1 Tax=Tasmannia lanceolata TaxID=3420 RepID=UPI004064255D